MLVGLCIWVENSGVLIYKFNFFLFQSLFHSFSRYVCVFVEGRVYFRKLIERWFWRCNKFNMFPRFLIIVFQFLFFSISFSCSSFRSVAQCLSEWKVYVQRTGGKLNTWTLKKSGYGIRMLVIGDGTENCIHISFSLCHSFSLSLPLSLFLCHSFEEFSLVVLPFSTND